MKIDFNKKYNTIAIYACAVIALASVFGFLLFNFGTIKNLFGNFLRIINPIIYGFVFAYLLNHLVKLFEQRVFAFAGKKKERKALRRNLSILASYITVAVFVFAFISIFIPQIISSYNDLINKMGEYVESAKEWVENLIGKSTIFNIFRGTEAWEEMLDRATDWINNFISNLAKMILDYSPRLIAYFANFMTNIFDIIIGLILSVYFLAGKEKIAAKAKMLCASLLPKKRYDPFISFTRYTNKTFGGFIVGEIIDSLIVAAITYTALKIFGIPYAEIVSVIVGVTNVIPYFGAIIGAIPSAFIIFIADPVKAFWFVILIIIIQQTDANIIGPRIVGGLTGLSAVGVITGILLMGGLLGVVGVFIGVPLFAVLFALAKKALEYAIKKREESKVEN